MNRTLITPVALVALMAGCESRITGNEGNFEFSYVAEDKITDFNKPVGIGAFLDMEVRDVGKRQPVDLSEATFDDTAILDVDAFGGHELTITGTGDGGALLSVAGTTVDGEDLTDSVNMQAKMPDVVKLRHTCDVVSATAHYLTNQRVWVPFELEMSNGQPVIGYGLYPVSFDDETAIKPNITDSGQQYMAFDTTSTPGAAVLSSNVDSTAITMDVIDEASIDGVMEPIAFVFEDIDVGDTNAFYTLPTVAGVPVCQADTLKTVQSDTPTICNVRDRDADSTAGDLSFEFGWFEIEGVAAGTCQYTLAYTGGNGGMGASGQFTFEIQP